MAEVPAKQTVVAIDGPSGSGKSTIARALAERLGFQYLDTGAMYRAVTWYFLGHLDHEPPSEAEALDLLAEIELSLPGPGVVHLNGEDVSSHLRSREVESRVSAVSAMPVVRSAMRQLQRAIATQGPVVAEGRDMATVVFPEAPCKFFLDASPQERARRRHQDFVGRGREVTEAQVLEEIQVRDHLDSSRKDAPLRMAEGATYVDTTAMDAEQVLATLERAVREVVG